jgi:hypothetical protein
LLAIPIARVTTPSASLGFLLDASSVFLVRVQGCFLHWWFFPTVGFSCGISVHVVTWAFITTVFGRKLSGPALALFVIIPAFARFSIWFWRCRICSSSSSGSNRWHAFFWSPATWVFGYTDPTLIRGSLPTLFRYCFTALLWTALAPLFGNSIATLFRCPVTTFIRPSVAAILSSLVSTVIRTPVAPVFDVPFLSRFTFPLYISLPFFPRLTVPLHISFPISLTTTVSSGFQNGSSYGGRGTSSSTGGYGRSGWWRCSTHFATIPVSVSRAIFVCWNSFTLALAGWSGLGHASFGAVCRVVLTAIVVGSCSGRWYLWRSPYGWTFDRRIQDMAAVARGNTEATCSHIAVFEAVGGVVPPVLRISIPSVIIIVISVSSMISRLLMDGWCVMPSRRGSCWLDYRIRVVFGNIANTLK